MPTRNVGWVVELLNETRTNDTVFRIRSSSNESNYPRLDPRLKLPQFIQGGELLFWMLSSGRAYIHPMNRPLKRQLGRRELVDFPAFALNSVEAKVDTGAFTSAIHCSGIHIETGAQQRPSLVVHLFNPGHEGTDGRLLTFTEFGLRDIRSSNGEVQERYVIRAVVQLFGEDFETEFSLSDRSDMKYPVLLGRSLLCHGRFVVDVAKRNLSYKALARAAARRR